MSWWKNVWGLVKKSKTQIALEALGFAFPALKIGKELTWLLKGIAFVVKTIQKNQEGLAIKKKKLLGVGLSLITSQNCSKETFNDAQLVLRDTPIVMNAMLETNFTYGKEICDSMLPAYTYAEDFIESCYVDEDDILKDTGKMIKDSYNIISRFCNDGHYREVLSKESQCQSQASDLCVAKYRTLLREDELLLSEDAGIRSRNTKESPDIKTVCFATEKVNTCAEKAKKSLGNCPNDKDEMLEETLVTDVDTFCGKHRNWVARSKVVPDDNVKKKTPENYIAPAQTSSHCRHQGCIIDMMLLILLFQSFELFS